MTIFWYKRKRPNTEYYSGTIRMKYPDGTPCFRGVGWAIRTKAMFDKLYFLVPTGEGVTQKQLMHSGKEIGPFDSLDAAKAAAEIMIGLNHV